MATKPKVPVKRGSDNDGSSSRFPIPWNDPEVAEILLKDLSKLAANWHFRSSSLPNDPLSLKLARILSAVSRAAERDPDALSEIDDRALELLRRQGDSVVRRTRREECERLKSFFGDPNQRNGSGWLHHPPANADPIGRIRDGLARHFVIQVLSDESFFRAEFATLGLGFDWTDLKYRETLVASVTTEFVSILQRAAIADRAPDVERLIRRGLVAMGYPVTRAKNLFNFESVRSKRRWEREDGQRKR